MDHFHAPPRSGRLVGNRALWVLPAGGYAVQAHRFVLRRSDDVDKFTTASVEGNFPSAVADLVAAYDSDGLTTTQESQVATFARPNVIDPNARASARVEL